MKARLTEADKGVTWLASRRTRMRGAASFTMNDDGYSGKDERKAMRL